MSCLVFMCVKKKYHALINCHFNDYASNYQAPKFLSSTSFISKLILHLHSSKYLVGTFKRGRFSHSAPGMYKYYMHYRREIFAGCGR